MGEIVRCKKYTDTNNPLREKEDFTYTLFDNLDFSKDNIPISFFRSDFRGAKFNNVTFYRNNFDRADLISCTFIDCKFIHTDIAASEIKNCYFENVEFTTNIYNNTSIQECTFAKCVFRDENMLVNMKSCRFIESELYNCKFERSTTEKINIDKCTISSVDLANMHAERYSFKSSVLSDVDIDICYIFGYLFYDTNVHGINTIYMGNKIEFTKDNMLDRFVSNLWSQERYYEFINANIIFNNISSIPQMVIKAFDELSKNTSYLGCLEALNIFTLLQFYSTNNMFNFNTINKIISFFDNFNWDQFKFDEKILYLTQIEKFKLYLSEVAYDNKFIETAKESISFITFYCNSNDYEIALSAIKQCLVASCRSYGFTEEYEIIYSREGSWIITVAVITTCALVLPKIIKKYADIIIEISMKRKISGTIAEKLNKNKIKIDDLKQISAIATSTGIIHNETQDIELSDLAKIIEMIQIDI